MPLPSWSEELGSRPTLYVSLGTVPFFNQPSRFQALPQELVKEDLQLVVTVSDLHEPAALGDSVTPGVRGLLAVAPVLRGPSATSATERVMALVGVDELTDEARVVTEEPSAMQSSVSTNGPRRPPGS